MNVTVAQYLTKRTYILIFDLRRGAYRVLNSLGFPDGQVFVYFEVFAASNMCRTLMRTTFNVTEVPVYGRVTRNVGHVSCLKGGSEEPNSEKKGGEGNAFVSQCYSCRHIMAGVS
jgi:hypothetical protein